MARKPSALQVAKLSQADHLLAKLVDVEKYLGSPAAANNGAAFVAGTRLAVSLRADLEGLRTASAPAPQREDPTEGMSDDAVAAALGEALRQLPLPLLDQILELVGAERREVDPAPPLRLVEGGT